MHIGCIIFVLSCSISVGCFDFSSIRSNLTVQRERAKSQNFGHHGTQAQSPYSPFLPFPRCSVFSMHVSVLVIDFRLFMFASLENANLRNQQLFPACPSKESSTSWRRIERRNIATASTTVRRNGYFEPALGPSKCALGAS